MIIDPQKIVTKKSKFLDDFFNDPIKYTKFKSLVNEMMEEAELIKKERDKYGNYTLPLGFDRPMILSGTEETAIADAILVMARSINEGQYILKHGAELVRIEVSDYNQKDVPIPYIKLHVRCLLDIAPVRGFYLRGIFNKEKVLREIVNAKIKKIVYFTESNEEKILMSF